MTPDDMAEKIVRYEWQSIAELASLLGTWRNEIVAATREERFACTGDAILLGDAIEAHRMELFRVYSGAYAISPTILKNTGTVAQVRFDIGIDTGGGGRRSMSVTRIFMWVDGAWI